VIIHFEQGTSDQPVDICADKATAEIEKCIETSGAGYENTTTTDQQNNSNVLH
jgi:hypothetical protein